MRLRIEVQRNRDFCGRLVALGERVLFGPVWCAGRANDAAACARGNDGRSYLLPYGDTPPGIYKIKTLLSMRGSSERARTQFGRFGIVSLVAVDGPALIADSIGALDADQLCCTGLQAPDDAGACGGILRHRRLQFRHQR